MDCLTDEECKAEFCVLKNNIYPLKEGMQLPDEISAIIDWLLVELRHIVFCSNDLNTRYSDMCSGFSRPVPQLSMIASEMMNLVYNHHSYRLKTLQQNWLSPASLQNYADVIHNAGAPYTNCWGFVDGTVRPVCKPGTFIQ